MALPPCPFTSAERDLIRNTFMIRFGQAPSVVDGIWLRTWRGGDQTGQPRIPKVVAGLLERGLVEIGPGRYGPCAHFTSAGLDALRAMTRDRRALDPKQYAHLRGELGEEMDDTTKTGAM